MPWWRRLYRSRRDRRGLVAGTRPTRRRWPSPRLTLPLVLLILAAVGWFARSQISDVFNFTQDQTKKPEALHPTQVRASSAAPGHRAGAAFDGFNNRYWAPASTGPGTGQYLEADFDKPVRLQKLLITPGISANEGEFLTQARPAKITITMVNSKGKETTKSISLHDQPGGQPFDVKASDLARVRLTTDASFGARATRRLAIAEIEFFGRR